LKKDRSDEIRLSWVDFVLKFFGLIVFIFPYQI
jgi:hypothetical protein